MEDYAARIELDPQPQAAAQARRWMRDVLDEIGRPELAESASAGLSELVTNGILHAHTTISVSVRYFRRRVVVTVTDRSPVPTPTPLGSGSSHREESTVGRGLRIVRAYATDWGVTSSQHAKAIWFVPSEGPHAVDLTAADVDLLGAEETAEPVVHGSVVRVVMRDAPVLLLRHYQERWNELLREMHLIALGEPSDLQALASELTDLVSLTRAARWMTPESTADFTEAVTTGVDRVDLTLDVPRDAGTAFRRVLEISKALEEVQHQDLLLYVGGGEQGDQLRDWWLGEIARQVAGDPPTPWAGSFTLDPAWHSS